VKSTAIGVSPLNLLLSMNSDIPDGLDTRRRTGQKDGRSAIGRVFQHYPPVPITHRTVHPYIFVELGGMIIAAFFQEKWPVVFSCHIGEDSVNLPG
jgi:hypothetical protein